MSNLDTYKLADRKELEQIIIDVPTHLKSKHSQEWRTMGYYVEGDWPVLRYDDPGIRYGEEKKVMKDD